MEIFFNESKIDRTYRKPDRNCLFGKGKGKGKGDGKGKLFQHLRKALYWR